MRAGELAVAVGRSEEVDSRLELAARISPIDEHLHAQLIQCLAAAGRSCAEIAAFRSIRRPLLEELAVDPSPVLVEAHEVALREPAPSSRPSTLTAGRRFAYRAAPCNRRNERPPHFGAAAMSQAHITRSKEARRIGWIGGTIHQITMDGAQTERRLTLLRTTFQQGAASPVHVHDRDDETFCVLDGQMTIWAGGERWQVGAGDTAFLPRGLPHAYLVDSPTADVLTVCAPSGIEDFFMAAGWDLRTPVPSGWSVDLDALGPLGERAGQRVLGAPLSADQFITDDMLAKA